MIKDKDGHILENLTITTALRDEMVSEIKKRIIHNLEAIEQFLKVQGYENVCAGLYTYALEEYGKILFLKDNKHILPTDNTKIKFRYRREKNKSDKKYYGFLAHEDKFSRMIDDNKLENRCKVLSKGDFEPNDVVLRDYEVGLIADMEARMALFFAEFKDENTILDPPPIDRGILERNVNKFLYFMRNSGSQPSGSNPP
jgi:hypothetical protein